jgi:hypothetical protein
MQVKCQQCHRPNDVAPFALMTHDDAVTYAADIKTSLNNKTCRPEAGPLDSTISPILRPYR